MRSVALLFIAVLGVVGALPGCHRERARPADPVVIPEPAAEAWSDDWILAEGRRYIGDARFRREALLASLTNHANSYSGQRIGSYGLETRGWDVLPVWNPRSGAVTTDTAREVLAHGTASLRAPAAALWDGRTPTTMTEWIALGREVFFGYPLRAEVFMEFALAQPALAERVGVQVTRDGLYPGLRVFADVDGRTRIGITCAVCHTQVTGGVMVVGSARREFDYGQLRLAYHRTTGAPLDPELARRMELWGPGRADVTEDEAEDPVAVPDLWGLRAQTALTQAGTIRQTGPTALAIRQETQLLHSNHQRVRPPRELSWALTMFLYSLAPPAAAVATSGPSSDPTVLARGRELFGSECRSCHSNAAYGGRPVPIARVGTDPALAMGGARGTGVYRPPALLRVREAAPYLHHGAVPSLEDLLSPQRFAASYRNGTLGPGAVPGHTFGTDLPEADRAAIIAWMRTL